MKILVTGSSGLIGSALVPFLTTGGHHVTRLMRREPRSNISEARWDPAGEQVNSTMLEGYDAVIHLAGENLSSRWTAKQKQQIYDSRVRGTRVLCEALARLHHPPKVLICASAIGYYGNRGEEILDEHSAPGQGFLPEVCRAWETATESANRHGIRVVNFRFGIILSPAGGALAKMLLPFRIGVGGVIGSGRQYWSWIGIDDAIGAIHHALMNDSLRGPVNAVSPNPVTNREFTKIVGRVLKRPTLFPVPAFALHLVFGKMADEMLLASARVMPTKLLNSGYNFRFPELEGALRHLSG